MSTFRIVVHMHQLFTDYRSSSRLFITSKIKTIEDLKKHISNLFDLHVDFYLISNNLYLPNSEDVRILREDDIVVVIPCIEKPFTNAVCSSKSELTLDFQNASASKTSKRRRAIVNEPESESFDFQGVDVKKKKKRKKTESENVSCTNTEINCEDTLILQKKEKKKTQKDDPLNQLAKRKTINKEFDKNQTYFSNIEAAHKGVVEKENKIKEKINLGQAMKSNSELPSVAVNSSRKPFIVPRKNIKLMEISTKPKIIKSICVRDTPVNVNYVNNVERISSNNICKESSITAMHFNSDKSIPITFSIGHETDKSNEQPCPIQNYLNEKVNLSSQQICKKKLDNGVQIKCSSNQPKTDKIAPLLLPEIDFTTISQEIGTIKNLSSLQSIATFGNKHINSNENIKIISAETLHKEPNQSNSEQLLTNETIGPQLIPLPQSTATETIVSNSNENDGDHLTSESAVHSVLSHIVQSKSANDEGEFKHSFSATPSESLVSSIAEESGVDLSLPFEAKRKRKRVRKRKPKTNKEENGFEPPGVITRPVFTSAAPVVHIRFDNEQGGVHNENVTCEDATDVQNENMPSEGNTDVTDSTDVIDVNLNYDKLCQEQLLLKFPVMKDKLPRGGDIVAFKICRLSECYTPEISDVIIAKVLSYCPDAKNVVVRILEGADQCYTPEGKFYMEPYDNNDEEEEKSFSWSELIEPRLLFP